MNRYGSSAYGGASRASTTTLCQKCLKRDFYECKAVAQERPYVSRPSRTQQLYNPKLVPNLNSDVPQELLRKKGIADEQLSKSERERGRKRDRNDDAPEPSTESKLPRSASSSSSASVATISTNASKSSILHHESTVKEAQQPTSKVVSKILSEKKRRRSISSEGFVSSDFETSRVREDIGGIRSTRRKIGDLSPLTRGRPRGRSYSPDQRTSYSRGSPSRERDVLSGKHVRNSGHRQESLERRIGLRSQSRSPIRRPGRSVRANAEADVRHRASRDKSKSPRSEILRRRTQSSNREDKEDGSKGRGLTGRQRDRSLSNNNYVRRRSPNVDERYGIGFESTSRSTIVTPQEKRGYRAPPRDRSLSPFSKRLAMTQAMNMGR